MLMKKFSIGYNTLMDFPYQRYLEHAKMMQLENKEEQKKQNKQEDKMNKHT